MPTILFLAANSSSSPMALDREARDIRNKLRAAMHRDHFEMSTLGEVTPGDLQDALLEKRPTIVHFSGHGRSDGAPPFNATGGIMLCSEIPGEEIVVGGDALAYTFARYQHVRMVVLNACDSLPIANAVANEVEFVVGMDGVISDKGARLFSVGLYRGLANGETVKAAFEMGIAEMMLHGCKHYAQCPALRSRAGVDPASTRFDGSAAVPPEPTTAPPAGQPRQPPPRPRKDHPSTRAPRPRATRREFRQNLDRHRQWARFKRACETDDHLVMWAVGDRHQSLELFYDRVKLEYPRKHRHNCYSFGIGPGDDATAQEWEDLLRQSVPDAIIDSLDGAIAAAARDRPALFVLDNQRGPLDEDSLGKPHLLELVEFIETHLVLALKRVAPPHPVRLFVGIQKQGESELAAMLRAAVQRARNAWAGETGANRGIGRWEAETIDLPTRGEVVDSIEEQLEPADPLSEDERDAVKAEYARFPGEEEPSLRSLADRLYPHYVRFHAARATSTNS